MITNAIEASELFLAEQIASDELAHIIRVHSVLVENPTNELFEHQICVCPVRLKINAKRLR